MTMQLGHRRYRVRGLSKNLAFDQMKVNVLATTDKGMYVDTFDLYVARHRRQFIAQAAIELGVEEQTIKKDLGRVLLEAGRIAGSSRSAKMMEPKEPAPTMTPEEKDEAVAAVASTRTCWTGSWPTSTWWARRPTSWSAIWRPSAASWTSRLAIIIQSSSAAGKTSLMDAILSFVPPEDQVKYSAMTGPSRSSTWAKTDLKHKILAIVEEEGAERASYALKLLQSEGALDHRQHRQGFQHRAGWSRRNTGWKGR